MCKINWKKVDEEMHFWLPFGLGVLGVLIAGYAKFHGTI